MKRIGIFVCHCGTNIAGTVDVERVVEEIAKFPEVVYAVDYKYMCSDPGQQLIRDHIRDDGLDAVIVAACSPAMHETTFRRTAEAAGVNPYQTEIANIREQSSWVHQNRTGGGDQQGHRDHPHHRGQGPLQPIADALSPAPGQAGAGHRRRHRRDAGGPGHGRRGLSRRCWWKRPTTWAGAWPSCRACTSILTRRPICSRARSMP